MTKTENYIFTKYNKSKWPYIGVNELIYDLRNELTKDQVKDEIRELRKSETINLCVWVIATLSVDELLKTS